MFYVFCDLGRAHRCPGAWEVGPVVPGPPPLGPWGASRGLPGGGPGPMSAAQNDLSPLGVSIVFNDDFDIDF